MFLLTIKTFIMKTIKKIKFSDIKGMLKRDGMREIIGGSGSSTGSGSNLYGGGGGTPALSSNPFNTSFTGSNYGGFGGNNAIDGGVYGSSGNFAGNGGNSAYNYIGGFGTNNLNSSTSNYSYVNGGWTNNSYGFTTTNPYTISRYFDFLLVNNGVVTNTQINNFIANEATASGQEQNNIQLYGTILNNVNVVNNYKGPIATPNGMFYNNGVLEITNSGGTGVASNEGTGNINPPPLTSAVYTSFTRDQIVNGFKKIDFGGMSLKSITDWDPVKNDFNYNNRFQPTMRLNSEAAVAIALYEKLSLRAYDNDGSKGGNATIGFGHLMHTGALKANDLKSITVDDAVTFLAIDLVETQNNLNQKIENLDLGNIITRNQYFALADMAFNAGTDKYSIVTDVLNALKNGGTEAANNTIQNAYQTADPDKGLMERRYFEAQAFINGRLLTPEESTAELVKLGLKK